MAQTKSETMIIFLFSSVYTTEIYFIKKRKLALLIIFRLMMNYSIDYTKCPIIIAEVEEDQ